MVEYAQNHFDAARAKFQSALSLNPAHERSLLALGELQLRSADPAGAAQTLEKAYQANGADWRAHLLLATAYAQQKKYDQALPHAVRAAELGREHAAPGWMLAGKILMNQGKREEAKKDFAVVLRSFPQDAAVPEVKSLLAQLEKEAATVPVSASAGGPSAAPSVAATVAAPAPIPAPPPPPVATRPWAPPDIDSKEYPAVDNVACSEEQLLAHAQARMMHQLGNFEKFLATEHIAHQEVGVNGIPGPAREKDFTYLVFIEHPRPGRSFLSERRDGGENLSAFPTSLATQGLFALAVDVFSPDFQNDLIYKCEGLGSWRGQAAWRLRFSCSSAS